MDDLLTPTEIDAPSPRGRRRRNIALIAATLGVLIVAGAGTAVAVEAGGASLDRFLAGTPGATAPPTDDPVPAATPTVAAHDGSVDDFGNRIYTNTSDPASVTYPDSLSPEERARAELWVKQQLIVAQCMADKGFDYHFSPYWERNGGDQPTLYPIGTPGALALWGANLTDGTPYNWENAGCDGYAVHVTGQDDAD
ncbi:hypothetical protein [Plantibacter sp. YIM 135347]|uniref:hypothetical protein n=1 Tax=Plantibacter sp. YIM 135347 TaxID=3423919 RepID=UPI003D336E48